MADGMLPLPGSWQTRTAPTVELVHTLPPPGVPSTWTTKQDELAYKKQQLQSAAATGEALKAELAARRAELDNLDSLGVKIQEELADIERQRGLLQADLDRYGRSSEIRREVQQQLSDLGARQAALSGQRDAVKVGVVKAAARRVTGGAFGGQVARQ
jgi:chromosome segregation ATPase